MMSNEVSLYQEVWKIAQSIDSRYRDTLSGRDALLVLMDMNGWFGLTPEFRNHDVYVSSVDHFRDRLELWLRAYKRTGAEKIDLMLEAYHEKLPDTCDRIAAFMMDENIKNQPAAYKMTDFILASVTKEIAFYTQDEVDALIEEGNREMELTVLTMFGRFLNFDYNGSKLSNWSYRYESRQIVKQDRSAYSLNEYAGMAYAVFDQEFWEEHDLVRKACGRRKYADLWLYTAMHFMGAVRKSDFKRLPIPSLPYAGEDLRNRICDGTFSDKEARAVTDEFEFRLEMKPKNPHKSRRYSRIGSVKIQIPESIKAPLGIIMAISLSFREAGDPFVGTESDPIDVEEFFGERFTKKVATKIHSRRANKSYMQGIDAEGGDEVGKPKGYMLASLARSHKCSLGGLSDVTDVYLQDAAFTGYTPEFILMEMFERGIFGFIPALLLEMYSGKDFCRIGVAAQTKMIKEMGLSALQLEEITETVTNSFYKAGEVVETAMNGKDRKDIGIVMQRIAAGAAPAKSDKFLCLMTAADHGCVEPSRSGCMGCRYEIYTKSSVQILMREYRALCTRLESAEGTEKDRVKKLLKNGIIPCVSEVISSIQMMYPNADMETILEITERGRRITDDDAGRN